MQELIGSLREAFMRGAVAGIGWCRDGSRPMASHAALRNEAHAFAEAEVATMLAGAVWRPIDSAPKWEVVLIAHYQPGSVAPDWIAAAKRDGIGWGRSGHRYDPTHWMPMLAPPRDSDGSGEAGQTAKRAGPKATARAEGIAQPQVGDSNP